MVLCEGGGPEMMMIGPSALLWITIGLTRTLCPFCRISTWGMFIGGGARGAGVAAAAAALLELGSTVGGSFCLFVAEVEAEDCDVPAAAEEELGPSPAFSAFDCSAPAPPPPDCLTATDTDGPAILLAPPLDACPSIRKGNVTTLLDPPAAPPLDPGSAPPPPTCDLF